MKVLAQEEFKNLINRDQFKLVELGGLKSDELPGVVALGDSHFLRALENESGLGFRILMSDLGSVDLQDLVRGRPNFINSVTDSIGLDAQLRLVQEKIDQKEKARLVAKGIQKKRKELEELNEQLVSESQVQFSSLEKSNVEEMQKNLNEKSLLYFLDFISSESLNDDFVSQILKLIWKELKKMGHAYQIGFCFENLNQSVSLIAYNGISERNEAIKLDINSEFSASVLATALSRPVGKILSWKLTEFSRKGYFFIESIDGQFLSQPVEIYFKERLFTLSLYFDRWLIEKEFHLLIERWDRTFQSFSGYTHVIDENYIIYQSNYLKKSEKDHFCYQVLADRDKPCLACPLQTKHYEFQLTEQKKVRASVSEFKHLNKKFYFMFYEDRTNLDLLKSKIIQSEKMATVGRLGNHLSHELNNPLTGLKLFTQLLLSTEKEDHLTPSLKSDLNEILKASERCEKIIKNLLQFSQEANFELNSLNFSDVLESTLTLLKTAVRPHRLFIDLRKNQINADFTALQQVLFNILKNACQAMSEAGTLKVFQIDTESETIFCIQDSGPGLSKEISKNIFSPFLTTKKVGEGTGLGLYLSRKLMQRMNADIKINTNYKNGLQIDLVFKKL